MGIGKAIKDEYNALLVCEYPERLYHYTTFDALESIVESRLFRATHRSYMKDCRDLSYCVETCVKHVQCWVEKHKQSEKCIGEEVLKKLEQEACRKSPFSFSVSFTEQGDGKKQWKEYLNGGSGLAICMDCEGLKSGLREVEFCDPDTGEITGKHFIVSRVEYDQGIQERQVVRLLEAGASNRDRCGKTWPHSREEFIARPVSHYLIDLSRRTFKRADCDWEREWKATPHVSDGKVERSNDRPYVEMQFDPTCIRGIVVGSLVPFEGAKRRLRVFLSQHGLCDVEIRRSAIPLVPHEE